MIEPKPLFRERIRSLLGKEADEFFKYCYIPLPNFIRCNTIKISPEKLVERLNKKWEIRQPFKEYPEIIEITSKLMPGELGKAREHLLGYYYVQSLSSMMPVLILNPNERDSLLDLCASPGSKTTQAAARMQNSGIIIANDRRLDRIIALNSNLERCGVSNVIVTREDGVVLCSKFNKLKIKFDKIIVDVPCSGEGTARADSKILKMWNINMIKNLSNKQKRLLSASVSCLKENGTLIYSTCTLAPEENEFVVKFILDKFPLRLEEIKLPIKTRKGITRWQGERLCKEIKKCCRIYPQDNNSEGFFIAKFTLE